MVGHRRLQYRFRGKKAAAGDGNWSGIIVDKARSGKSSEGSAHPQRTDMVWGPCTLRHPNHSKLEVAGAQSCCCCRRRHGHRARIRTPPTYAARLDPPTCSTRHGAPALGERSKGALALGAWSKGARSTGVGSTEHRSFPAAEQRTELEQGPHAGRLATKQGPNAGPPLPRSKGRLAGAPP